MRIQTLVAAAFVIAATSPALAAPAPSAAPPGTWMKPGQWDIAVTIDSVQIQGPMAGMGAMLKGKTTHSQHCLTKEEAANGSQQMLAAQKDCTHAKHVIAKGHISSEMTCHRGQTTSQVATDGEYTPTSFKIKSRAVESGGSMPMIMDSTSVGARIGDCS